MNPLVDTHAHLYAAEFETDRNEMMERTFAAGVERIFLPNVDSRTITGMLALESAYAGRCFAMMGLHPCSVKENYKDELQIVEKWLAERHFVAVGEIGIDLYWDKTHYEEQIKAFRIQINWAKSLQIPIIIHARDALDVIIDIVKAEKDARLWGIFHCFTGNLEQANQILDLGFYLGIGGVVTFKKSGLDAVLKNVPLSGLVLETDAPYLAPTPHRGKRNESSYIVKVAESLAAIKGVSTSEVASFTTNNAYTIFKMSSANLL